MARLKDAYVKDVAPALMKKFSYKSVMQIPKLDKVVINVGCGEARDNPKIMDAILSDLAKITGQKAVVCRAKKSVANFKLREGMPIGAKVTLRGERMYEFVDRFFSVALPRVRDFRGINGNSFDGRGNYSCGVKEQLIFPEIDYDKIDDKHESETADGAEVQHTCLQPLQNLRPPPRLSAQIWRMPYLLPRAGL